MISKEQEDELFKNLLNILKPLEVMAKDFGDMEISAIWMIDNPLIIDGKKHCRFESGDRIRIINDQVESGESNAKVIGTFGLYSRDLKMTCLLDDGTIKIIKL